MEVTKPAEAFDERVTNWWQRECAGRNASERRASLEKDKRAGRPDNPFGEGCYVWMKWSGVMRPDAAPGVVAGVHVHKESARNTASPKRGGQRRPTGGP